MRELEVDGDRSSKVVESNESQSDSKRGRQVGVHNMEDLIF